MPELIRLDAVSKRFGGVTALDAVSFGIARAEVHAVVGGNGAGKSSLMNLLAGVERADAGRILLNGQPLELSGPLDARRRGISIVFQEPNLFSHRSVTENIFLNRELVGGVGMLRHQAMRDQARAALDRVGLEVSPDARISALSVGERQLVEIARALEGKSEIVIFDEPNSALTDQESQRLFELIETLAKQGVTIVYVSQRLEDVFSVADRITVLRDGRYQGTLVTQETNRDAVITRMLGRAEGQAFPSGRMPVADAPVALRTEALGAPGLGPIDLTLRAGHIVGVAGLEGSGVQSLFHLLFGLQQPASGRILYHETPCRLRSASDAMELGAALIPASRRDDGLMLDASVAKNATLCVLDRLRTRLGLIDGAKAERETLQVIEQLGVVTSGPDAMVGHLSGGNQQKVLLGRWLATRPTVLLLDDPTRGVDIGAKQEIYRLCDRLARNGLAVLFASSELDETLGLCDQVLVMSRGRIVQQVERGAKTKAQLMQAMNGIVDA